jgi:ubiquinone/menaquinone biosynthesis C-methylase UbiE
MADDPVRERFRKSAGQMASRQDARAEEFGRRVQQFVLPRGHERALDVGTGTGALALAFAPHVQEVVGVDMVPELLELARERGAQYDNVTFVEGDATRLDFADGWFHLVGTARTLHHVQRPELVIAELSRVTRRGGHVLVIDQLAPNDPLDAADLDHFERTRDPSHARLLPDTDLRTLFDVNRLALVRAEFETELRELESYLDLAACEGEERERAAALAPEDGRLPASVGWYLLRRA